MLENAEINKPFLLSGGIHPHDADVIRTFAKGKHGKDLFAVDINSKFETSPGIKNMQSVQSFVDALKSGS